MKFKVHKFQSIDSTNKYALEKADTLENYSVICARTQSAGKGRKGRKWISTDGENLYFSLLIRNPAVEVTEISGIPQLMALSVYKTLLKAGILDCWIKWPNDVFVDDRKICGILCESRFKGSKIDALVIGVGVNVNASKQSLSTIDIPATSVLHETGDGDPYDIDQLLHVILNNFDHSLNEWLQPEKKEKFTEEWRSASRLIGKPVKLIDDELEIYGTVADFSVNGEIILQTEKGFQRFSYGDISLRVV